MVVMIVRVLLLVAVETWPAGRTGRAWTSGAGFAPGPGPSAARPRAWRGRRCAIV